MIIITITIIVTIIVIDLVVLVFIIIILVVAAVSVLLRYLRRRSWKVPGFKRIAKGLVGGATFRVLLEGLEKLKDRCNTCVISERKYILNKILIS